MGKLTPKGRGFDPDGSEGIIFGEPDKNKQPRTEIYGRIYLDGQYIEPCPWQDGHDWLVDDEKGQWKCMKCGLVPPAYVIDVVRRKRKKDIPGAPVEKPKNPKWTRRARIFNDQLGVRLTSYGHALITLQQVRHEINAGSFDPSRYSKRATPALYLETKIDELFAGKESRKQLAPSYIKDYKRYCESHKQYFRGRRYEDITGDDFVEYELYLRDKHPEWQPATLKNYLDHLYGVFKWLFTKKKIKELPEYERIKVMTNKKGAYMAPPAQAAVLSLIANEMDRQVVRFLMLHGRRPSEARALKKKCIDPFKRSITFDEHYSGRHIWPGVKSRLEAQTIPIHPAMEDWFVQRWKEIDDPEGYIFVNPRGRREKHKGANDDDGRRPYREGAVRRLWDRVRTACDLPRSMRMYDATRHSATTQMSQAGKSAESISQITGQTPQTIIKHYLHDDLEHARECINVLSVDVPFVSKLSVAKKKRAGSKK